MNLTELKNTPVSELITLGENMGLENQARMRKQDIIFAILSSTQRVAKISLATVCWRYCRMDLVSSALQTAPTSPVLMISTFPPAKSAVSTSALVTPFQVRFVLLKRGERYFALLKVNEVNYDKPENSRNKICLKT
ncbi:Transcription termination factor Rho [Leclercia adecarboxylata]|uniref:Transcription termination factor Rho n=1 Tax=Leclercia adecarboxylata TaxID=83655 RepID=A0A4U9IWB8_9ENTR|nr:Transcription termination factor Rho [Leclercia adecarboxylata]